MSQAFEDSSAALEIDRPDLYGNYLLRSRTEILFVLRSLVRQNALLTLYADTPEHFFLSRLLAVDEPGASLVLDSASDDARNERILRAQRSLAASQQDRVKVQFPLLRLSRGTHEAKPALLASFPTVLLRLQRREYFRLEAPPAPSMQCQIPVPPTVAPTQSLTCRVLDLSGGGISLAIPESQATAFPVGTRTERCRIALPDEGIVTTPLIVRSASPLPASATLAGVRLGCEFAELTSAQLSLIQRYITRLEREGARTRKR